MRLTNRMGVVMSTSLRPDDVAPHVVALALDLERVKMRQDLPREMSVNWSVHAMTHK